MQKKAFISRIRNFFNTSKGRIIGLWLAYFFYWGALAPLIPYMGLYYESIGLTGSQIGILGSMRSLISFISAIALAFLSDVIRQRKHIIYLCIFGMIAVLLIFPQMMSFASLMVIVGFYSIFQAPTVAIIDEDTLRSLENPRNFAQVRIGGSAGWGVMVFLAGLIMDKPGIPLNIMFTLHIILLLPLLILVFFMPDTSQPVDESGKRASFSDIIDLLRYPGFALWMVVLFLFGAAEASLINFLFLHVRNLGGNSTIMGLTMVFAIIGEIIGFTIAKRTQYKIGSRRMMVLSIGIRTFWYFFVAFIRQPLWILPIQMLGGISFALIESGSVAYVNERAPRRIGTTAQGMRSAILLRLSTTIGALIAGALYEGFGPKIMYIIMGCSSIVALAFSAALRTIERRSEAKTMSS